MHLGDLLSTQEARVALYASFVLSNLQRASITPNGCTLHVYHFLRNADKHSFLGSYTCSVVLFMIGFLSFISKIDYNFLPCLFFVFSFRCR